MYLRWCPLHAMTTPLISPLLVQIEDLRNIYSVVPPALFAQLRASFQAAMDGLIAALPTSPLHPIPPPPSPQLVNTLAAVVNSIRHHIHASPATASQTVAFLTQKTGLEEALCQGHVPLSPAVSMGSSTGGMEHTGEAELKTGRDDAGMHADWDAEHATKGDLYGAVLRQRPLEDDVTPGRRKIRDLLQAALDAQQAQPQASGDAQGDAASDAGSTGSGGAFSRSEAVLGLVAEELTQVPQLYARANVQNLMLNLDDLVKAVEELRQSLTAFVSLLP